MHLHNLDYFQFHLPKTNRHKSNTIAIYLSGKVLNTVQLPLLKYLRPEAWISNEDRFA